MTLLKPIGTNVAFALARHRWHVDNPGKLFGLSTGIPSLDRQTGGLEDASLTIIGGDPGSGKTALALQIAYYNAIQCNAEEKECVVLFSLEMKDLELHWRLASFLSGINGFRLKMQPEQFDQWEHDQFEDALISLETLPILLCDEPGILVGDKDTVNSMSHAIDGIIKDGYKPKLVIVDYVQISGDAPEQIEAVRIGKIALKLKHLAMRTNLPILAMTQLTTRAGKLSNPETFRPTNANIAGSSEVEKNANAIWLLHNCVSPKFDGKAVLIVTKNRNGPLGELVLALDKTTYRYSDAVEGE